MTGSSDGLFLYNLQCYTEYSENQQTGPGLSGKRLQYEANTVFRIVCMQESDPSLVNKKKETLLNI